ncbi:cornichon protein-domain-containing protein [Haematococcus lacustris]|nr:hypothetical protein QJQ45_022576 [Haematococcus lacustris]
MVWSLLVWLLAFVLQAGLLGRCMYGLISLSDLEQDFLNPLDLSRKLNAFVWLEYSAQFVVAAILVGTAKWVAGGLHVAITAYMVHLYLKGHVYIDATDAFRQLKQQKFRRGLLFGAYCLSFVFLTYRLIETAIHTTLTPEGRETAKKLFKDAAASLHGY